MLTGLLQTFLNGVASLGDMASVLPRCPFVSVNAVVLDNRILSMLAWFIPFDAIIGLLQAWLAAVGVWYVVKTAMRWKRLIQ